jgi:hypothetical protein
MFSKKYSLRGAISWGLQGRTSLAYFRRVYSLGATFITR